MRPALDLTPDLAGLAATLVYLVVFGFVFVESGLLLGFLLPGDSLLFAAGLVSATDGSGVSLTVLVIGVLVAAVAGDSVGYAFGARLGRPWLDRRAAGGRLDARHLRRAESFYQRFGWFAVVAARWIPWVRTFTPVLAGAARMPYRRFLPANVAGAVIWGPGLLVLGHVAATEPTLRHTSYAVAGAFIAFSLVLAVVGVARRRR
ncbi:MAG: DedA family protein [Sporichthyaceae bacterium]